MNTREVVAPGALRRYVLVGFSLCALLQLVFWGQIGRFGVPLADWPFLLAYSQKAMLDLVVFAAPGSIRIALWFLAYLAIAVVIWLLFAKVTPNRAGRWNTVVFAWIGTEVALGVLGLALLKSGVLQME